MNAKDETALERLAVAVERVADALESEHRGSVFAEEALPQMIVRAFCSSDEAKKVLARVVIGETLRRASRGVSSLPGGPLGGGKKT